MYLKIVRPTKIIWIWVTIKLLLIALLSKCYFSILCKTSIFKNSEYDVKCEYWLESQWPLWLS